MPMQLSIASFRMIQNISTNQQFTGEEGGGGAITAQSNTIWHNKIYIPPAIYVVWPSIKSGNWRYINIQ